jgi:hypothetical protein
VQKPSQPGGVEPGARVVLIPRGFAKILFALERSERIYERHLMDWPCQAVQVAIFGTQTTAKPDALIPWMRVFKGSPDGFSSAVAGMPGASTAHGVIGNLHAVINFAHDRMDLILSAPPTGASADSPPLISDFEDALGVAISQGAELANGYQGNRFAVVGTFMSVHDSMAEANQALATELPRLQIPDDCWDPSYQMNIRKTLPEIGLANRLRRWSVGTIQMVQVQVGPTGASLLPSQAAKFVANAMIDVNSVPENPPQGDPVRILSALAGEMKSLKSASHDDPFA